MNKLRTPAGRRQTTGDAVDRQPRHPVRVVAERTGLSPAVLRAWEHRHGLVTPSRTAGAQRLYSDADVERLQLIGALSAEGHSLSDMARRPTEALRELRARSDVPPPVDAARNPAVASLLAATIGLDGPAIRQILSRALLQTGPVAALDDVITPFLRAVGDAWECGETGVANEHLATSIIRDALGAMLQSATPVPNAPVLLSGTLSGELHELGAMMACVVAAARGWRVLHLGPNLPAIEFVRAAKDAKPRVVCIGIAGAEDTRREIAALRHGLGAKATIVAGGDGIVEHRLTLRRSRVRVLADRRELVALLDTFWHRAT